MVLCFALCHCLGLGSHLCEIVMAQGASGDHYQRHGPVFCAVPLSWFWVASLRDRHGTGSPLHHFLGAATTFHFRGTGDANFVLHSCVTDDATLGITLSSQPCDVVRALHWGSLTRLFLVLEFSHNSASGTCGNSPFLFDGLRQLRSALSRFIDT